MKWKNRNLRELADIICGNSEPGKANYFLYRSSSYLTEFFEDCDLDFVHDGSTRSWWVANRLEEVLAQPHPGPTVPPDAFIRIIRAVLDKGEAQDGDPDRSKALAALNAVLTREGWESFYDEHDIGQLRHIATNTVAQMANPHRPMTPAELERRDQLTVYLDKCSEDGGITKQARNWLGNKLDATKRSQIMFIGQGRHSHPVHRDEPAAAKGRAASREDRRSVRRRYTVLAGWCLTTGWRVVGQPAPTAGRLCPGAAPLPPSANLPEDPEFSLNTAFDCYSNRSNCHHPKVPVGRGEAMPPRISS